MSKAANIMIGIILFGMICLGSAEFINGFKEKYDLEVEEGWEDDYDLIDNMTTISKDMSDILESKDTNWVISGLRMGYSVLKNMFRLPKFVSSIFNNIADRLNIPNWAVANMVLLMTIIIMIVIAAALLRWFI